MTDKHTELRQRMATILADLEAQGRHDGEAMFMLGSIAARTADLAGQSSWTALKPLLTSQDYSRLFAMIAQEGEQLLKDGKTRQAYALQAMAISLVAARENDPVLNQGAVLLDAIIDEAVANYRQHAQPHLRKAN